MIKIRRITRVLERMLKQKQSILAYTPLAKIHWIRQIINIAKKLNAVANPSQ